MDNGDGGSIGTGLVMKSVLKPTALVQLTWFSPFLFHLQTMGDQPMPRPAIDTAAGLVWC